MGTGETKSVAGIWLTKDRWNTIPAPWGYVDSYTDPNTLDSHAEDDGTGSLDYITKTDVITYERGHDRKVTRECMHVKESTMRSPASLSLRTGASNYAVLFNKSWMQANDANQFRSYTNPVDLPESRPSTDFNSAAFEAMTPDLESSLSTAVFLLELTDLVRLKDLFTKWKGYTRKIAEGHLSYSFGVKPFISDCMKMWDIMANHQKILLRFMSKRNVPQVSHFTEGVKTFSGSRSKTTLQGGIVKVWSEWAGSYQDFATMRYSYDCPNIDSYWRFLQAMSRMIGLNASIGVAWEKLPFSFVVDWILRIGNFVEQFDVNSFPVTVKVDDYLMTRKLTYAVSRYVDYATTTWLDYDATHQLAKETHSSYQRRRVVPVSGTTFINRGQYGLNQLALSASLLRTLR